MQLADLGGNFIQVNFFFRLKGVHITGDVKVKAVFFNFLHGCNMGILVHILTPLVCLDNLINVAFSENVLIFASLKIIGSVDEKDVVRVAVAFSLEDENTNRNAGAKEKVSRKSDDGIQNI